MPSVMDMVEIMERLESKSLRVDPAHCVRVRNRNASCSLCANACPSGAISIRGNSLDIDAQSCVGCGACATACPSNAISSLKPSDEELGRAIDASARALDGMPTVVCARVAARHTADVDAVAAVPCVSRLDVCALVGACMRNEGSLTVVDGVCETCKYRTSACRFDESMREANDLLEAWGGDARVVRVHEVPACALARSAEAAVGGVSRRGFFTGVRSSAKEIAVEAVNVTVENELGMKKKPDSIRSLLKVGADGNMPRVSPVRHDAIMEYLYEAGEPRDGSVVKTSLWGDVSIDEDLCINCGICSTFCPTGALSKVFEEGPKRPVVAGLEFRLADCVQCRLCEDVCMRKALHVGDVIPCDRILDFEPREFAGRKSKGGIGLKAAFDRLA